MTTDNKQYTVVGCNDPQNRQYSPSGGIQIVDTPRTLPDWAVEAMIPRKSNWSGRLLNVQRWLAKTALRCIYLNKQVDVYELKYVNQFSVQLKRIKIDPVLFETRTANKDSVNQGYPSLG